MYTLVNTPKADRDIFLAADWYETQQAGLGNKFIDDLEVLCGYIENNPRLFTQVLPDVHQAPLKKFPYVVLYKIKKSKVFIIAVFNCYQDPAKKSVS